MSIGPPTGMRDWLPQDTLLRQHLMETIGRVYRLYGYLPIDTPAMEDLAVLLGKGGGENEKLLFKILKRGEKLEKAGSEGDLADYGLRFDLTVPLARFVATHQGKLPKVFRRYHIAPVWRADRPQKGRFREFYQCDIDVVGGASPAYEVEIITATERVLKELNLGTYRFRVSDKRLLPLLLTGLGVPDEHIGPITILLDKLDKVGTSQVCSEILALLRPGSEASKQVEAFILDACESRAKEKGRHARVDVLNGHLVKTDKTCHAAIDAVLSNLDAIMGSVLAINPQSAIVFDPILVRGMDYYTGPVYEAVAEGYPSAILGGGRYDDLIGKFAGKKIPAVGCSIGFERILAILQERDSGTALTVTSQVLLINEGVAAVILQQQAEHLRNAGLCVETYLDQDEAGKQFKYAEAAGMHWAIRHFDAVASSITVRDLSKRQDLTMSLSEFKTRLDRS
jgi:histidyl-tRNA synthetase